MTLCAYVVTDWRTGQWDVNLPADGFTVSTGIQWSPEPLGAMRSYCKTIYGSFSPSPATKSPTSAPSKSPTPAPTKTPTLSPTKTPTKTPSKTFTLVPSRLPTRVPSTGTFDLSYVFPPVATSQFVHGLCVLGASEARAISDDPQLFYTSIPNFRDDVTLWSDRGYKTLGVDNEEVCEGGTYLQPSLHKVKNIS